MLSTIIALLIALAILGIAYVVLKWIVSKIGLSAPITTILDIIFGVAAIILVLKYLTTLL